MVRKHTNYFACSGDQQMVLPVGTVFFQRIVNVESKQEQAGAKIGSTADSK
jgi:hypothetical protein